MQDANVKIRREKRAQEIIKITYREKSGNFILRTRKLRDGNFPSFKIQARQPNRTTPARAMLNLFGGRENWIGGVIGDWGGISLPMPEMKMGKTGQDAKKIGQTGRRQLT